MFSFFCTIDVHMSVWPDRMYSFEIRTTGLPTRCTMGLRWHFCRRGPISNPRPVLDFPAQTTRGKVLDFFVKSENELVMQVFEKTVFSVFLATKLALWVQIIFLVSPYSEHKSCSLNTFFERNRPTTKLSLVHASTISSRSRGSAWLPELTKQSICQRSEAPQEGLRPLN